jgi:uncharacterized protein (DUF1501 family)
MASNGSNGSNDSKRKNLVVVQLSGGNDYLNTMVPYQDGLYYDYRPNMGLKGDNVIPIDDRIGFNSHMAPFKRMYDKGMMAILMGIGYPEPNRSHFRSMDIWHTAEPTISSSEGWLGKVTKALDPEGTNPVTAVNFGRGLPRALAYPGVSVASVGALDSYGLYTGLAGAGNRDALLDTVSRIYQPMSAEGFPSQRILETGRGALDGADLLREAPGKYKGTIEYPEDNPIAQSLKGVAQVTSANLGTKIYYTAHGPFDTHTNELINHALLWDQVSEAVELFWADMEEQGEADDTVMWIFSEFGRRVADNGTGTDHGSGGCAFLIGPSVKGGLYGEYPDLSPDAQLEGDIQYNMDYRDGYATILESFMDLDSEPILNSKFSQLDLLAV